MVVRAAHEIFRGVVPVIETPFLSSGEVDAAGFVRLVGHVSATGVDGIMFPGFASEFSKLTRDERRELTGLLIDGCEQSSRSAAIISVPDHATLLAVEEAQWAVERGAHAINILPPFFLSPSRDAIRDHLRAVLGAVGSTPVIVQLAPGLTGSAIAPSDIDELAAEFANLAAVKVEAVPPGRMVSHFGTLPARLPCLVGYAGLYLPDALRRGAVGVQPGCSFIELYQTLWAHWAAGDHSAFDDLHRRMAPYLTEWMHSAELIVQVEKTISMRRGLIDDDVCRAPTYRLDDHERATVERFLAEFAAELGLHHDSRTEGHHS